LNRLDLKAWTLGILSMGIVALPMSAAQAHHSTAPFDLTKEVEVKGTIKEVQWTNPHAWIQVNVPKADGAMVEWSFETEGPNVLTRAGIFRNTLKPGDVVTVKGHPLKDGRPGASMITVEKDDGSVLSLRPNLRKPPR
jgi:DNA/RNA endonuclease YhcR with UshA esterase domain